MKRTLLLSRVLPLAALATALGSGPALADFSPYALVATIPVAATAFNPTGEFKVNDVSYLDQSTGLLYLSDRSNNAEDVFSALTDTEVGKIGVGDFVGVAPGGPNFSGPNGVQGVPIAGATTLYAGDGDSDVPAFTLSASGTSGTLLEKISTNLAPGTPATNARADEMAYDPTDHILAVANDAASPTSYMNLIDTQNDTVVKQIPFDGTNGTPNTEDNGLEATVYDANTGKFYSSIPQIGPNSSDPGGIATTDPLTGAVSFFDFSAFGVTSCNPAGLVQGAGNDLLVGCSNSDSSSLIVDPTANNGQGALIATFPQVQGSDQVAFDPSNNLYFLAARDNATGPVLGIIDGATDTWLQNIPTVPGAHAVQVYDANGQVFVPLNSGSGNKVCAKGCVGVYDVPEPSSLALMLTGLAGFLGLGMVANRRRHTKAA